MFQSCTKKYTDESNEELFCFTFYCDDCNAPFHSTPISFKLNSCSIDKSSEYKLWKLQWQQKHKEAFARANQEAKIYYFCCPGCGRHICPACVVTKELSSGEVLERCWQCTVKSNQERPFQIIKLSRKGDRNVE